MTNDRTGQERAAKMRAAMVTLTEEYIQEHNYAAASAVMRVLSDLGVTQLARLHRVLDDAAGVDA